MSEPLILLGAIAVGLERWTELLMNIVKAGFGEPTQAWWKIAYRATAFAIAIASGVIVMYVGDLDLIKGALPGTNVANGKVLSGILAGLGSTPTHEVVKYIEEKKNQAKRAS